MNLQSKGRLTTAKFEDLMKKMTVVKSSLASRLDTETMVLTEALIQELQQLTPAAFFHRFKVEELSDWFTIFIEFLQKSPGVSVDILPFGSKGRALLLTNCKDVPFLLSSIQIHLISQEYRFRVISHPILSMVRENNKLVQLGHTTDGNDQESFIIVEIEQFDPSRKEELESSVKNVLEAALVVERDGSKMRSQYQELQNIKTMEAGSEFRDWLQDGNFRIFSSGTIDYTQKNGSLQLTKDLDVLGYDMDIFAGISQEDGTLSPGHPAARRLLRDDCVLVDVAGQISPILRSEPLMYIGFLEKLDENSFREHFFIGLFSRKSISEQSFHIPALRQKIRGAMERLGIPKNSHDYRKTVDILNTFPKGELFFLSDDDLTDIVRSFAILYRHGVIKVIATQGLAHKSWTLLLLMPRDFYTTESVKRIESYLARFFTLPAISVRSMLMSSDYISLHFVVKSAGDNLADFDIEKLEKGLTSLALPWEKKLRQLLERTFDTRKGYSIWRRYADNFPREYKALAHPRYALRDIRNIEKLLETGNEILDLWGPFGKTEQVFRLQFYSLGRSYLNDLMPYFENLSLIVIDEVDFTMDVDNKRVYVKSFTVKSGAENANFAAVRPQILDALYALRSGLVEDDYLNRLILPTGLSWKEVDVFRGYRNYYFQLGTSFTKKRVAFAFINNPEVSTLLYQYFECRFINDPKLTDAMERELSKLGPIRLKLIEALQNVTDIMKTAFCAHCSILSIQRLEPTISSAKTRMIISSPLKSVLLALWICRLHALFMKFTFIRYLWKVFI